MSVVGALWSMVGWRGMAGALLGALVAGTGTYHAGRLVERAACAERIEKRLAQHDLKLMERNNARLDAAIAARRRLDRDRVRDDDGRLPDDGFRRD
ncbi:MAG: hypothetical protein AAGF49_04370 [Pseudomonadota bacterium]